MSAVYAEAFKRHVMPVLHVAVRKHAIFLCFGKETFTQAHGQVVRLAINRGANYLSSEHFEALIDQIGVLLLDAAEAVSPMVAEGMSRAEKVATEIAEWEEKRWHAN